VSLIWYLENVFYESFGQIFNYIQQNIFDGISPKNEIINIGFWPGGDRDGNPFVTPETTIKVAERLKETILKNYYRDARKLRRKLTFKGVEERINSLEDLLYKSFIKPNASNSITLDHLTSELEACKKDLIKNHQSLYIEDLNSLINKVNLFGLHFATLDIRQDSRVHHSVFTSIVEVSLKNRNKIFPEDYDKLTEAEQIIILSEVSGKINLSIFKMK